MRDNKCPYCDNYWRSRCEVAERRMDDMQKLIDKNRAAVIAMEYIKEALSADSE